MLSAMLYALLRIAEVAIVFLVANKVSLNRRKTLGNDKAALIVLAPFLGFLLIMMGVTMLLTFGYDMKVDTANRIGIHIAAISCLIASGIVALRVKRDS